MINAANSKFLRVRTEGTAGPYIRLPESQLENIGSLLDRHGISYWVEEVRISRNGKPFNALVNFGRKADPEAIQRILDGGL